MKKTVWVGSVVGFLSLLVPCGAAFAAGGTEPAPAQTSVPTVVTPGAGSASSSAVTSPAGQGTSSSAGQSSSSSTEPVTAASSGSAGLAFTGAELGALVGLAAVLIFAGLFLIVAGHAHTRSRRGTS